jgi:NAD(P)-dependent dehydrogenase (short-subunit alcohol dehydrogenase family)
MGHVCDSMDVNYFGAMNVLDHWAVQWRALGWKAGMHRPTFVAVSSNSAQLARSRSLAYCASKAALSMAIRCAARELAPHSVNIWGVEPGWISDTPMSEAVHARIVAEQRGLPNHRIPGGREVHRRELGRFIAEHVSHEWDWMNGCMLRLDGGDQ